MKPALEESGHLVKIEDYKTKIGRSERTNSVVEAQTFAPMVCENEQPRRTSTEGCHR